MNINDRNQFDVTIVKSGILADKTSPLTHTQKIGNRLRKKTVLSRRPREVMSQQQRPAMTQNGPLSERTEIKFTSEINKASQWSEHINSLGNLVKQNSVTLGKGMKAYLQLANSADSTREDGIDLLTLPPPLSLDRQDILACINRIISSESDIRSKETRFFLKQLLDDKLEAEFKRRLGWQDRSEALIDIIMALPDRDNLVINLLADLFDQALSATSPLEHLILDETADWVQGNSGQPPTLASLKGNQWAEMLCQRVLSRYSRVDPAEGSAVKQLIKVKFKRLFPIASGVDRLTDAVLSLPLASELATLYNIGAACIPPETHKKYWPGSFALAGADFIQHYQTSNSLIVDQMLVQQAGRRSSGLTRRLTLLAQLKQGYGRLHDYVDTRMQEALRYSHAVSNINAFLQKNKKEPLAGSENKNRLSELLTKKAEAESVLYHMAFDHLPVGDRKLLTQAIKEKRVTVNRFSLVSKETGAENLTMTSLGYRIKVLPPPGHPQPAVQQQFLLGISYAAAAFPPVQMLRVDPASDTDETQRQGQTEKVLVLDPDVLKQYQLQETPLLSTFYTIDNEASFIKALVAEDPINFKITNHTRSGADDDDPTQSVKLSDFLKELGSQLVSMTPLVCLEAMWDLVKTGGATSEAQLKQRLQEAGSDSFGCFLSLSGGLKAEVTAGKFIERQVTSQVAKQFKSWVSIDAKERRSAEKRDIGRDVWLKNAIDNIYHKTSTPQPQPRFRLLPLTRPTYRLEEFKERIPTGMSLAFPGKLVLEFAPKPGERQARAVEYATRLGENKFIELNDSEGFYQQEMVRGKTIEGAIVKYLRGDIPYSQLRHTAVLQKHFNFITAYADYPSALGVRGFPDHTAFSPGKQIIYESGKTYIPVGDKYFRCEITNSEGGRVYKIIGNQTMPADLQFYIYESNTGFYFVNADNTNKLIVDESSQSLRHRGEGPEEFIDTPENMVFQGLYAVNNKNKDYILALTSPGDKKIHYRKLGRDRKFWPLSSEDKLFMPSSSQRNHYDGIPLTKIENNKLLKNEIHEKLLAVDRQLIEHNFADEIINTYSILDGRQEPEVLKHFAEPHLGHGGYRWRDTDFSTLTGNPMSYVEVMGIRKFFGNITNGKIFTIEEPALAAVASFFRKIGQKLSQSTSGSDIYRMFGDRENEVDKNKVQSYIDELHWLGNLAAGAHRLAAKRLQIKILEDARREVIESKKSAELKPVGYFYNKIMKLTERFDPVIEKTENWTYKKIDHSRVAGTSAYSRLMSEFKSADNTICDMLKTIGKDWAGNDPRWEHFKTYFNIDPDLLPKKERERFSAIMAKLYDKFYTDTVYKNIVLLKPVHDKQGRRFIEPDNKNAPVGIAMDAESYTYKKGKGAKQVFYNLAIDPLSDQAHKRTVLLHEVSHQVGASGRDEIYYGFFRGGMRVGEPSRVAENFIKIQQSPYIAYGMACNDLNFATSLQNRLNYVQDKGIDFDSAFWHSKEVATYQLLDFGSQSVRLRNSPAVLDFFKKLYEPQNARLRWHIMAGPHPDALVGFVYYLYGKLKQSTAPDPQPTNSQTRDKRSQSIENKLLPPLLLREVARQSISAVNLIPPSTSNPALSPQINLPQDQQQTEDNDYKISTEAVYVRTYFLADRDQKVS
ncbi:MAG: hypothetical protein P4L95_20180 [Rouxiella aceris]|uniref:hypothetical protein n=1 Tax=Rouxiella aceris TaxID=2703884 RepID=UPI002848D997|nr:hypothetical protein [Rouxiella aceris]MDR3434185.1 hypothetical protein [Rouxiella aceris]